jgi:hypothetical protein
MTINYLIPLHKPSTRHVGDIVYIKKSVGSKDYTYIFRPLEKSRYRLQCFLTATSILQTIAIAGAIFDKKK